MNAWCLAWFWSVLLFALPAAAGESSKDVWAGDARVQRKVSVAAEGVPIRDLLATVAEKTGVSLSADEEIADEKVILFGPARPLRDQLVDLAALLNCSWGRQKTAGGNSKYRLERGVAARQLEARLARAEIDRMLAQLATQVHALGETPEQLERRPESDQVRRNLQDTRFGSRTATLLYSWLMPEQRELLFSQNRLWIPFRLLTPDQQAVVRKSFDEIIAREQTEANEVARERPGAITSVSKQEDLDRFGITFILSRQGGRAHASVKLGNRGYLFLSHLNTIQGFLLPPHGNPYTGTGVSQGAVLPPVRITEAAIEDKPLTDRLRKLAEEGHLPVLADYYRVPPISRSPSAATAGEAPHSAIAALDAFCQRDGYLWWIRAGTLLLRKRDWYQQRLREVPDRWLRTMIAHLEAQKGLPTYADVLRLRELTLPQITGLYLLAEQKEFDERFFLGLHELLALVGTAPRPLQGPLPIGDLTNINDANLEARVSLIQDRLAPRQEIPFTRLLAMQSDPIPPEVMGGEFKVRFFCRYPKPQVTHSGYRFIDVGIRWHLHKMSTPVSGYGYAAGYDVCLPLSLPVVRQDQTKVDILNGNGPL